MVNDGVGDDDDGCGGGDDGDYDGCGDCHDGDDDGGDAMVMMMVVVMICW